MLPVGSVDKTVDSELAGTVRELAASIIPPPPHTHKHDVGKGVGFAVLCMHTVATQHNATSE